MPPKKRQKGQPSLLGFLKNQGETEPASDDISFEQVDLVTQTLKSERENASAVFGKLFKEMERKAFVTGATLGKPRSCKRQTLRENVDGSAEDYYRCAFLAFVDHVLQEMQSRFTSITKAAALGLCLLPCKIDSLTLENEDTLPKFYRPKHLSSGGSHVEGSMGISQ